MYKYADKIREFLKFKPDIWTKATTAFENMKQRYCLPYPCTLVSIHIRLSDYERHLDFMYEEKTAIHTDYLKRAMEYFQSRYLVS